MYQNDYNDKMQTLLYDRSTYKSINKDLTMKIQTMNNKLVDTWHDYEYITKKERNTLGTKTAIAPRIYGLPKIHETGNPLRPIVSNINAPTYELGKFLSRIIHNSIDQDKYNVLNSYTFKEFITKQKIPQNYILISLDVVSLFTNIPTLPLHSFHEGLNWLVDNTFFVWNGKFYLQQEGTSMGSCLSPAIADLVMDVLLDEVTSRLSFPLPFIKKYVDDLVTAVPYNKIEETLTIFNSYCDKLQFTIEEERDGRLPFLDMTLCRNTSDGSISTVWYRKPTSSGKMLNFLSAHNINQKISTATGFIHRVISLTSNITDDTFKSI